MAYKAIDGDGVELFFRAINSGIDEANALLPELNVANFPPNQNVTVTALPTVSIGNFPANQAVTIGNFPASQDVIVTALPTVSIGNFPASQTVIVDNFPASQDVVVTALPSVSIGNFPANQNVTVTALPTVSIGNFPASQDVVVTDLPAVSIDNFPASQIVTQEALALNYASSVITTSGDTTVIDITTLPGYVAGTSRLLIVYALFQHEDPANSTTPTSILYKAGTDVLGRGRVAADADGFALLHKLLLPIDASFVLNLADAITVGYTIHYVLEG